MVRETTFAIADGPGKFKCVSSTDYITRIFLLSVHKSIDDAYASFTRLDPNCKYSGVSPPYIMVPVLSLTETQTSYENAPSIKTPAVKKASPSKPTVAPTIIQTHAKSVPVKISPASRGSSPNKLPQTTSNVAPRPSPHPNPNMPSPDRAPTSRKALAADSESQPAGSGGENTEAGNTPWILRAGIDSLKSGILDVPGSAEEPLEMPNDGELKPGQSFLDLIIPGGGQAEARPQLVLSIGSSVITANGDGNFVVADQTLAPGGPPVTALGKSIYLQPSNAVAIIDGETVSLNQAFSEPSHPTPPATMVIGSTFMTANQDGNFVVADQRLVWGGSLVAALGKSAPVQPSGLAAVIDQITMPLFPSSQIMTAVDPSASALTVESRIAGQTLVAGAPPISIFGRPVSLARGGSHVVIGSSTKSLISASPDLALLILNGIGDTGPELAPTSLNAPALVAAATEPTGGAVRRWGNEKWRWGGIWTGLGLAVWFAMSY